RESRTASACAWAPAGTMLSATRNSPTLPDRDSWRRRPTERRNAVTGTSQGLAATDMSSGPVLVEECILGKRILHINPGNPGVGSIANRRRGYRKLLPSRSDRFDRAVENHFKSRQLLVAVVLGLEAESSGVILRILDDSPRRQLRFPHHFGALHHSFGV